MHLHSTTSLPTVFQKYHFLKRKGVEGVGGAAAALQREENDWITMRPFNTISMRESLHCAGPAYSATPK